MFSIIIPNYYLKLPIYIPTKDGNFPCFVGIDLGKKTWDPFGKKTAKYMGIRQNVFGKNNKKMGQKLNYMGII